jgi:hypothetical protein
LVVAGLLVVGTLLPRLALCIGENGHRAIELLDAACCTEAPGDAGAVADCDSACTDTPLGVASLAVRSSDASDHAGIAAPTAVGVFDATSEASSPVVVPTRIAAPRPPRQLRTTVRLC